MDEELYFKQIPFSRIEKLKEGIENISINNDPLKLKDDPIAPIVTAHYIKDTTIFFRIVVFVDRENKIEPFFEVSEDQSNFRVVFDSPAAKPTIFTSWYFEAEFNRTINQELNYTVYNHNIDPRTSRGTVVVVSPEVVPTI